MYMGAKRGPGDAAHLLEQERRDDPSVHLLVFGANDHDSSFSACGILHEDQRKDGCQPDR